MARDPKQKKDPSGPNASRAEEWAGGLPDLLRRGLTLGLSGLFVTEEAVRRAFGDTLPRDWIDFASEQSARTRSEFLERLSGELARSLEAIDLVEVLDGLLAGRTLEVRAEIRLRDREEKGEEPALKRLSLLDRGRQGE